MNIILFEKHKTILNINALLCFCKIFLSFKGFKFIKQHQQGYA